MESHQIEGREAVSRMWVNRRRMAWLSLAAILFIVVVSMFVLSEARLKAAEPLLSSALYVLGSLVAAYMGLATFAEAGKTVFRRDKSDTT